MPHIALNARSPTFLCGSVLALVSGALCAQEAPPRPATMDEIAACLDAGDIVEHRKQLLRSRHEEHNALAARFRTADMELSAQVKRHAPRTKAEIESYNRAVDQRNKAARAFNERARQLEQEQTELNALILKTNADCGSLLVNMDDKDAVEQERRRRSPRP